MDGLCLQSTAALDTERFKFNITWGSMRYQEENCTSRSLVRNYKALLRSNPPTNNDLNRKSRRGTTTPISHSPTHLKQEDLKEDMKGDPGLTGIAFSTTSKTQMFRQSQVTLDLPTSQYDEPFYRCRKLKCQHGEDAVRRYPMVRYSSSEAGNDIEKLGLGHCGGKYPILGREINNSSDGNEFQLISNRAQFHTRRKRGNIFPLVESSF